MKKVIIALLSILFILNCQNKKEDKIPVQKSSFTSKSKFKEIDAMVLNNSIRQYLCTKVGSSTHGGKVFCGFEIYGKKIDGDKIKIYLWALCEEYYIKEGKLEMGTGSSIPTVLFGSIENGIVNITSYREPVDGSGYGKSVRELFDGKYMDKVFPGSKKYNERVYRLEKEITIQAKKYFKIY